MNKYGAMSGIELEPLMSICWRLNDHLRITPQSTVEYEGSQNDIEQFRETLHTIDPMFTHLRGMIAINPANIGKAMDNAVAALSASSAAVNADLLAALKQIVALGERFNGATMPEVLNEARAAIEKATL